MHFLALGTYYEECPYLEQRSGMKGQLIGKETAHKQKQKVKIGI